MKELIIGKSWEGILTRIACVSCFIIFFVYPNFDIIRVDGHSMTPTFDNEEVVFLKKYAYEHIPPELDDVVVLKGEPNKLILREKLIKRIVGIPGDKIEIKAVYLYVNDIIHMPELGVIFKHLDYVFVEKIPEDHYFYIGDNRADTMYGLVNRNEITGKIMFN